MTLSTRLPPRAPPFRSIILNEMEDGFEQKVAMDKEATLAMKR